MRVSPFTRVVVAAVSALIGFLLVSQVRGRVSDRAFLETASETDLTRILATLNQEADSLRDEITTLELQLLDLESASALDEAATEAAETQRQALEVLAGTVPVQGPGIKLEIVDSSEAMTAELFIDIVQELRDAGAEAIAVNGHRLGAASWFDATDEGVALDGELLTGTRYVVQAIGEPATLDGGLAIPGGIRDTLAATPGVEADVERAARLTLPALDVSPSFDVARPIASEP